MVKELGDDIDLIETSAKDNSNVNNAFMMLARKALKR
jgi:GTPase SAR1 family protein